MCVCGGGGGLLGTFVLNEGAWHSEVFSAQGPEFSS